MPAFRLFSLCFFTLVAVVHGLSAQSIQLPAHFSSLLDEAGLAFFEPLDAGYRSVDPPENDYQSSHFAIRSPREGIEIRYFILPWNDKDPFAANPHVATFRAVSSIASNAEEVVVSAIRPSREELRKDFNADWGMSYFFEPKPGFSEQPACRMVAISQTGKGTAFIFFLFDNPANTALDQRYLALRFL